MSYATARRLPPIKYKADERLLLDRWKGKGKASELVEVDVLSVRHEPHWETYTDGRDVCRHRPAPAIYQVRVVATGEEFPADERGLRRPPKA